MKLIHCADLHLDSKMTAHLTREQARERRMEILRTFSHMVEYASVAGVQVILIAGDLFDTRNVSATARNVVRDAICQHPEIDFVYLRGNHDEDNFLSKLEIIPDNLKLFSDSWTSYSYAGGQIVITGAELSGANSEHLYDSLQLSKDVYNIVTLHGQSGEYKSRNFAEHISLAELKNRGIDYLALGHVHSYVLQALDSRGVYCYSGCLEGRGFDECGQKGFVLLDIDESAHTAQQTFVSIAARKLHHLQVDVSEAMTTNDAARLIEQALNEKTYSSAGMVKITLTGAVALECELNCEYLEELFSGYFYVVRVENRTTVRWNYTDYEKDASLKGEFIRMVLAEDLPEEQKAAVIRCGMNALAGEESIL